MQFTLAMVFYLLKCLKKVYLSNGWSLLSDIEKWKGRFMYTMNVNDFFISWTVEIRFISTLRIYKQT